MRFLQCHYKHWFDHVSLILAVLKKLGDPVDTSGDFRVYLLATVADTEIVQVVPKAGLALPSLQIGLSCTHVIHD